nr:MLO-like protein 11 [Physcomitrium patens]|eukprot:XP_024374011.1 MLO-like protein 11 [Physcomitrella patens]
MAGDAADEDERSLEFTPTWALAVVSSMFVVIGFVVYLLKTKRKPLFEALQKIKDELMLVGFISLTLTVLENPVSKICIRSALFNKWTPCKVPMDSHDTHEGSKKFVQWPKPSDFASSALGHHGHGRRLLASETSDSFHCPADFEPFVSKHSLHQLHIFIFVLAGVHVVYSRLTMALALSKVYSWKKWEKQALESTSPEDIAAFIKYHTSKPWSKSRLIVWVVCFFQQFHIPRSDYLTLRLSFITTHNLPYKYNFHSYMIRSMENEFETIVGISAWLWASVIAFLLVNVDGVTLYFWASFVPVVVVLAIGMKLQHIVATLALETSPNGAVPGHFVGALLKPRDQLFWFNRPKLLLHVIHLVLFQNAYELATFVWHVTQFGFHSCLLEQDKWFVYVRLAIGLIVQLACSFSTLPLYALVSQMGTHFKKAVVPIRVNRVLHVWHKDAKKRLKLGSHGVSSDGSERSNTSSGSRSRSKLTVVEERIRSIREDSLSGGSGGDLSSPMSVIMEEGSLSPEDRTATSSHSWKIGVASSSQPAISSPPSTTFQNVWDR